MPAFSCDEKDDVKLGPKEIKLSAGQVELIEGVNRFGFDLFREVLSEEDPLENIFISPLSVHLALAMTWNGAGGNTGEQMAETMYLPDISEEKINEAFRQLISDLLSVDKKVESGIANSIWYRKGFSVRQAFLDINKASFDAEVNDLDFSSPSAKDVINAWVAEKTNNRIEEIVDQITPAHVMFLINAIYFKGVWSIEFLKEATVERPFNLAYGGHKLVPVMETEGDFVYAERDGYRVLELFYGRGNFSMLVFLPDEGISPDDLVQAFTVEEWNELADGLMYPHNLDIRLPKFSFDFDIELNEPLIRMGIEDAFIDGKADFSGINPDESLVISKVKHKTFIDVDEEGTEAAAVTSVEIIRTSLPPAPLAFHVDRPFVFALKEKYTNALIFIGKVMEP